MKNIICQNCGSPKYYCKGLCKSCYTKNLVPKGWSRISDFCLSCGKTDSPHTAKGLCSRCYATQSTNILCACGCGATVPKVGNKIRKYKKGHWMKNNVEFMKAHIQSMIGKDNPQYGKFGKEHPAFGHKTSDRTREERRQRRLKAMNTRLDKRTSIEIILSNILDEINILHIPQSIMYDKFVVDEFLPDSNVIIEAFGGYWHGDTRKFPILNDRQKRTQRLDSSRIKYLSKCGHSVLILWEKELNENPEWCREQILLAIN